MRELMKVLVTGSRDWRNTSIIDAAVHQVQVDYPAQKYELIYGCAAGADTLTKLAVQALGWSLQPFTVTPDDWHRLGPAAGHVRNQRMVDQDPDLCLAFVMPCSKIGCRRPQGHISHGTDDCMRRARLAGVTVREYPVPTLRYQFDLFQ
jgi:hypothetical protein